MDTIATLERVVGEMTALVDGVRPEQLREKTPCAEWTVRDLINHVTGGATMFAVSAEQGSVPDDLVGQLMGGDNLGDDFQGAFHAATDRVTAAFRQPGVLDKTVTLPFGEMPAPIALSIAVFDVATHAADLAKATGQPMPADEVLEEALALGKQLISPEMRQPGVFDAEQPADDSAPAADRLLAFAGRRP
jgi:uncharacterized protein (TIGR03086 family)